ncbi:tRNA (adenosine(37)-N6)-threonylcarbamoyltransferase complex dimerization subunit type 1 TsaB [Lysobacter sp. 5GHs7-4]|uniref:tRNA (adenosine(37)-N6)-threonylcarbamoyltransferase complex dimerization subunit type 1 TsaB n=1 Tax=Lysobacter sp. 5GHs7-4 TaxID=2904253 RepID=UPI001E551ACE|nr:tRNA (adenosine(37)-N6)-threonylcarbamoyltransferase complex dimerization subunit type 1 TsaB [Lysobacter sp. 5GHs7-4]UHQ24231.1 tRNA (adenosine(37)-N6)-threonylcarbamoyltransferase complex dimerization subunit type 1 TsaB [Lysobacter sp. 5GHs7-4]
MKLLAFETATEVCSVALWIDGEVRERHELAPRRHAELSLPWAEQLLADAGLRKSQLDAIALGRGPGAFTGVRLAIAIGQGIALALDRPIVAVSTLATLALQARTSSSSAIDVGRDDGAAAPARVLASIDARMGEIYTGAFELRDGDAFALSAEAVLAPEAATLPDERDGWLGVGTGFGAAEGALARHFQGRFAGIDAAALPHAADLARLAVAAYARGEALAPERVEPAYLRNNVALTIAQQQALRASR